MVLRGSKTKPSGSLVEQRQEYSEATQTRRGIEQEISSTKQVVQRMQQSSSSSSSPDADGDNKSTGTASANNDELSHGTACSVPSVVVVIVALPGLPKIEVCQFCCNGVLRQLLW
jgi:hypothetical protein